MNPCSAFAYFPFIFWLVFGLAGMSARGNEPPRKFFRDYKCYYELPDASWSWNNQPGSHILFAAKNSKGMFVTLQWFQLKQVQTLEQYVPVYEENYFKSGQFRKRGGRFLSFRGSPCYQLEASLSDGRTVVTRIFLNNYLVALQLTVIGGPEAHRADSRVRVRRPGFVSHGPAKTLVGKNAHVRVRRGYLPVPARRFRRDPPKAMGLGRV